MQQPERQIRQRNALGDPLILWGGARGGGPGCRGQPRQVSRMRVNQPTKTATKATKGLGIIYCAYYINPILHNHRLHKSRGFDLDQSSCEQEYSCEPLERGYSMLVLVTAGQSILSLEDQELPSRHSRAWFAFPEFLSSLPDLRELEVLASSTPAKCTYAQKNQKVRNFLIAYLILVWISLICMFVQAQAAWSPSRAAGWIKRL